MSVDQAGEIQLLIMMNASAPDDQVENVLGLLSENGQYGRVAPGNDSIMIGAFGDREALIDLALDQQEGVESVVPISKPYKLVSSESAPGPTVIQTRGRRIGGDHFALIAGPCTVETREQTFTTARVVEAAGATMLRGGAFKPRTSPYSFQGLGLEGLEILAEAREDTGLPLATEVLDPRQLDAVVEAADVIQIGARNMQNFLLLSEVGKTDKPVLLKRGSSASVEELLMAAEYVMKEGNPRVILCERGIKTFERSTRFTLDIGAVPVLKEETHLPVIVDPSHAAGRRELVPAMARAAVAAGADGIIVEAHPEPEHALCDAAQQIPTQRFGDFADEIRRLVEVMGKQLG
jgi:3-deoxy-7-phosphoheptulonate synthase